MDTASLQLLQAQNGACPLCGQLLLDADRPPQTPHEWEQWLTVTGKAVTRKAITAQPGGQPDEAKLRLVHATTTGATPGSETAQHLCPPASPRACFCRMHGNMYVRF